MFNARFVKFIIFNSFKSVQHANVLTLRKVKQSNVFKTSAINKKKNKKRDEKKSLFLALFSIATVRQIKPGKNVRLTIVELCCRVNRFVPSDFLRSEFELISLRSSVFPF